MSAPWMPLYVADYLADTTHLSAAEHGAYMLLILHYWQKSELPTDETILARICRMTPRQWAKSRDVLAAFFGPGWTHERIDFELEKARVKSEARAEYGSRGGNAKALKNKDASLAKATDLPAENVAKALASSSQPILSSSLRSDDNGVSAPRKAKRAKARTSIDPNAQPTDVDRDAAKDYGLAAETFRTEWRNFRDHHISRGTLMADWPAAWRTWLAKGVEFGRIKPTAKAVLAAAGEPDWRTMLGLYCKTRNWSWAAISPEPGYPGCKIPMEILAEFSGRLPPNPFAARAA